MEWNFNDGGRSKYFKGFTGDCVTRAIAIASEQDYKVVYDELNKRCKAYNEKAMAKALKKGKRFTPSTSRNGVNRKVYEAYLKELGFIWHPMCQIGSGCQMHLNSEELPKLNILIARLSRHIVCVKNGVLQDTYNSSIKEYYDAYGELVEEEDGRMVYGYYSKEA